MGTVFVAGSYGVGKSTLCDALSKILGIPAYSAGDLISSVNGEQYGVNKIVKDKEGNQDILVVEVEKKLVQHPRILLAGHFCIFDKWNHVEKLPNSVFKKIELSKILLLEATTEQILLNLNVRDKKKYEYEHIDILLKAEHKAAEDVSRICSCDLYIHQMTFTETDLQICRKFIAAEE